jgi:hypothetical protein
MGNGSAPSRNGFLHQRPSTSTTQQLYMSTLIVKKAPLMAMKRSLKRPLPIKTRRAKKGVRLPRHICARNASNSARPLLSEPAAALVRCHVELSGYTVAGAHAVQSAGAVTGALTC